MGLFKVNFKELRIVVREEERAIEKKLIGSVSFINSREKRGF